MKDERVSLETAKLLKEKNFNIGGYGSYTEYLKTHKSDNPSFATKKGEVEFDGTFYFINNNSACDNSCKNYTMYAAPTQSVVQRWLREVHNIQVYCYSSTKNGDGVYRDYVVHVNERSINDARDNEFQTYEEGMEIGLQIALKMI